VPEPTASAVYPLIAATRGGSPNLYQTGTDAERDRWSIGQMDSSHVIGFDSGGHMDPPLLTGFMNRVDGNIEILAAHPTGSHYLSTYHNITEAFADDLAVTSRAILIRDYIDSLDGPNGDDGWAYNDANQKVLLFANQSTINNSHHVAEKDGLTYPEWYADNLVQPYYIEPHRTAGVKIGGAGGINIMLDNFQLHSNKSGIDWNNDGTENNAQDWYDSEVPLHVATDPIAVAAYSSLRANMMKGKNRFISNNPGMWVLTNTNQWGDDKVTRFIWNGHVTGLRDVIAEYRLNGDPLQGDINGGFSEGNTTQVSTPETTYWPRCGVYYDGTNAGQGGSWQASYNSIYQSTRFVQPPGIVHASWGVWCLQSGTTGPGGKTIYSHIPASNAKWNLARWAMCTTWLAGGYVAITGIVVGQAKAGRASSTPHFDEFGIINTAATGLSRKWMGQALSDPPTDPLHGTIWVREFENALIVLNSNNDENDPPVTVQVDLLPGGASMWKRINGFQDPSHNDGSVVDANFSLDPIDAIVLQRRSLTVYPQLGTVRVGGRGYSQSGTLAATDRLAMGLMDAVLLGGFFGSDQDAADPGPNWISRTDVTQDILDNHLAAFGTSDIYTFTYVNQMETGFDTFGTKLYDEEGPNGTDWWFRNASGAIVLSGFGGGMINITDQVTPDAQGRRFPQYYADVRVIAELMDVHAAAGIGAGLGGMSPWYDNLGFHVRKSGIDPDQDGTNDDMQEFFDPDDPAHVAAQPKAVQFIGEYRANQRDGINRVAAAYPEIIKGGNSNQYAQGYSGHVSGLPHIIKEYRIDGDNIDSICFSQCGLSENNNWTPTEDVNAWTRSHTLWTGVSSTSGGSWQTSYNNFYMCTQKFSDPAIVFAEWIIDSLQSGTDGPGSYVVYNPIPSAATAWNMHRWGMVSALLCDAHYSPSAVVVGTFTAGERYATVLYDEMGLINGAVDYGFGTGSTKLYRKWMGYAVDPVQTDAWDGDLWIREFENALVIINTNWDDTDPAAIVDVSALPGGASEWTRIVGDQDPSWNSGADANTDFAIPSIDAIILARKSWYDALPPIQLPGVKWNPGHYVRAHGGPSAGDQDLYWAGIQASLDNHVMDSDEFLGAYIIYSWGYLETDNGVYPNWSKVHEHLDWLAARGKRLLLAVEHKSYNNIFDPEWVAPKNLENETEPHQAGLITGLWRPAVMDQYIAFMEAFAAEFDGHPALEQVSFVPETAYGISAPSRAADYSDAAYSTQLQRMYDAAALAFTQTTFTGGVNYIGDVEDELVEALYQNGQGRCGPDAHAVDGYDIFIGTSPAVRDYRGTIPHRVIVSSPNLGGFSDILPLSNIQALLDNGSVTHAVWSLISSTPGGTKTDIINWIETPGNETYQACPTRTAALFGGCK
jgi:hypothetical protein